MKRLLYTVMYWLNKIPWDTNETPPEVVEFFQADDRKPGQALDLGCGTGTNAIFLAQHGWKVVGVDFIPKAARRARRKAQRAGLADLTQFRVGDVARVGEMDLPPIDYALDIGCFHSLSDQEKQQYAIGIASQLRPGAIFMLYASEPSAHGKMAYGITAAGVRELFTPNFDMIREEQGEHGEQGANWFWMRRREQ